MSQTETSSAIEFYLLKGYVPSRRSMRMLGNVEVAKKVKDFEVITMVGSKGELLAERINKKHEYSCLRFCVKLKNKPECPVPKLTKAERREALRTVLRTTSQGV